MNIDNIYLNIIKTITVYSIFFYSSVNKTSKMTNYRACNSIKGNKTSSWNGQLSFHIILGAVKTWNFVLIANNVITWGVFITVHFNDFFLLFQSEILKNIHQIFWFKVLPLLTHLNDWNHYYRMSLHVNYKSQISSL